MENFLNEYTKILESQKKEEKQREKLERAIEDNKAKLDKLNNNGEVKKCKLILQMLDEFGISFEELIALLTKEYETKGNNPKAVTASANGKANEIKEEK